VKEELPTRKQRQAETRRRLLSTAARVFTARGYHGASVSEICRAAGFTTGALYANFAGKEQLFLELIDQQVAAQMEAVEAIAAEADPQRMRELFQARVEALMSGLIDAGDVFTPGEDGQLTTIQVHTLTLEFLLYAVRERPDLRRAIAERYRAVEAILTRLIEAWLDAEGRPASISASDLALAHSWLTEGLGLRLLQDPELISAAKAAHLFRTLVADLPLGDPPTDPPP
jgi:AcrR family transcriptional regulator